MGLRWEQLTSTYANSCLNIVARSWGKISACEVQRHAHLAYKDETAILQRGGLSEGHRSRSISALAALGAWGKYSGNVQRDLLNYLGEPSTPKPTLISIHVVVQKPRRFTNAVQALQLPFILPHTFFAYLYQYNKAEFDVVMLGATRGHAPRQSEFWKGVVARRDPRIQRHPMCTRPGWQHFAIPISIHGDSVPCIQVGRAGSKSLDVYTWQSVLAEGTSTRLKVYIHAIFEACKAHLEEHGHCSMTEIWNVIVWSLKALLSGKHPTFDWLGRPWPPGSAERVLADNDTDLAGGFFLRGVVTQGGPGLLRQRLGFAALLGERVL